MKNPYLHLLRTAWENADGHRAGFAITYLMFVIANILGMLEPLVIAQILNTLQSGGPDLFEKILPWIIALPLLDFAFWCFHGPARVMERKTAFFISQQYIREMFRKTTDLPLKWHRDHHTGETYDNLDKARQAIFDFSQDNFQYISTTIEMIIAIGAIIYFLPTYGLLVFVFAALVVLTIRFFDQILIRNQTIINNQENHVSSGLFDYISNITTVITLRLEKLAKSEINRRIQIIFKKFSHNVRVNEWKWFLNSMIVKVGLALLLALYIYQQVSLSETIFVGSIVALYQYLERLNDAFFRVAWQWEELVFRSTNVRSAETILDAHRSLVIAQKAVKPPKNWKTIQIRDLLFRYEDKQHHIHHLKDIDLTLKKGQKIALVGASGSGKSTLMKLLRELDTPEEGQISIDGKAYPDLSVLNQMTTLFPQDPEIFENTIEYNITAGIRHQKKDVNLAVRLSEFQPVLAKLPNGLATSIKERGVNLSGGEKQRLALARGIFAARDSSIILLDEPTSSIDSTNELKIYHNLFKHFHHRCIVSSIHRLHLLPLFDVVVVLKKGIIVEKGSFRSLVKNRNTHLHKMWEKYSEHS